MNRLRCGRALTVAALLLTAAVYPFAVLAQPPAAPEAADDLALRQDKIASKYGELEKLLLRMAEYEALTNPKRAAVLKQAAAQSSEQLTKAKLLSIAKLLNSQQFGRAIQSQTEVQADLKILLTLLQSENENANRKSEQQRIKEYIKEIQRLKRLQESLKARTEQTDDPQSLSKEQGNVADQAGKVKKEIAEQEGDSTEATEGETSDESNEGVAEPGEDSERTPSEDGDQAPTEKSEMPPGEAKDSQSRPDAGEEDAKSQPGQKPQSSPKGEPPPEGAQESPPSEGGESAPEPSEDGENAPPQGEKPEGTPPPNKRVEAAEKKMRAAQKKLEQAKRDEAVKEQQAAEEELKKAVAELEEILKQLREEEIEQTLADLSTRFRKMLEMQLKVNEATSQLVKIPADKRNREVDLQSTRLASDEQKILREAEKALTLLGDEGSSTAFPATVEQLCQDMQQIVERLASVKIDSITVGLEEEVVETLEELIAALDLEMKEREEKKQQEQESPSPQQEPGEDPLIDQIAELKMIRSLQIRINRRTERLAKLLQDPDDPVGQANSADLESALLELSRREADVFRITRDIVVGRKN